VETRSSLKLDLVPKTGTLTLLSNDLNWYYGANTFEDRVSVDIAQAIPFVWKMLLGVELKASGSFGSLLRFGGSNATLGIDSTENGTFTYGASVLGFIGIPLFNDLEMGVANMFVLQSFNMALVYEAGSAFNAPAHIPGGFQHAVGIELLPSLFGEAIAY
jgi:hypothetical protein